MTLLITFAVLAVASFALLLGLSLFLQAYLYNEPADRLWLRAAVGSLALACFLTGWVYVNTRADGDNAYGVLHEFKPTATTEVNAFEAVRRNRSKAETTVAYTRAPGEKEFKSADGKPFRWNSADDLTVAVIVKENDKPVRFAAVLDGDLAYAKVPEKKTFLEVGGSRSIEEELPGTIVSPNSGVAFLAILINVLHLAVWFAIFWLAMRFEWGHALGLGAIFALAATIVLMPLLFGLNKPKAAPGVPVAAGKP